MRYKKKGGIKEAREQIRLTCLKTGYHMEKLNKTQ